MDDILKNNLLIPALTEDLNEGPLGPWVWARIEDPAPGFWQITTWASPRILLGIILSSGEGSLHLWRIRVYRHKPWHHNYIREFELSDPEYDNQLNHCLWVLWARVPKKEFRALIGP